MWSFLSFILFSHSGKSFIISRNHKQYKKQFTAEVPNLQATDWYRSGPVSDQGHPAGDQLESS